MKNTIMNVIKLSLCSVSLTMVLSLAACTPTPDKGKTGEVKQTEASSAPEKHPDPTAPELDVVSIYNVSQDGKTLEGTMDAVEELNAESLVSLLIQYNVLKEGTEVVSYEATGKPSSEEIGPGVVTIPGVEIESDMNEYGILNLNQFPDTSNQMLLQAVGNTFIENMNIVYLTIQVNGETVAENLSIVDAGK